MKFLKKIFSGSTTKEMRAPVDLQKTVDMQRTVDLQPDEDKRFYGITDVGKVRDHNEDFFTINDPLRLYIVADGMGGHNAGEIASEEAVNFILTLLSPENLKDSEDPASALSEAIVKAHEHVVELADSNPDYRGMGCTIVIGYMVDNTLHSCHVGDARIYIVSNKEIRQMGNDHSLVAEAVKAGQMTSEEARLSPMKNQITMAVGGSTTILPEYCRQEVHPGERVLLCSDGLWDMMPDEQIREICMRFEDAESISNELLRCALDAGGNDNVTIITVLV